MILTICPNPSIDCTIELPALNVGMLNRIDNKIETYSGKALNVAIGISRLDESCVATGFMFNNHKKMFEQNLEQNGVKHDFVYNKGSARVNYKIIDKKSMLTEINDRGEEVLLNEQNKLIDKVQSLSKLADIVVMSGSLPKGVDSSFYYEVLKNVPKTAKIIVDTEKDNMLSAIKTGNIFLVKPNLRELEEFSKESIHNFADVKRASRKYLDLGVKNVLVSMGADGAIFTNGEESYYCKSASVAVNSTVGAGDSMISALSVGLERGVSFKEMLKMSVAAGTAAITTSGTNLFYKDKYLEIYSKIFVESI